MRYLINLTYDGNSFYGYQIQNNEITVEGELEKVLSQILNQSINTYSASRTDRGVHAYNQYCHFDYDKELDVDSLKHSINSIINDSIYVKNIKKVSDDFHARFNVKRKEYIYKINMGEYNPLEKDYVYQYNKVINEDIISGFISLVSGKHNFRSFTSDKDKSSYERDIKIEYEIKDNILYLIFNSSGFLRYMIRNIVGLLIDVNEGKKSLDDIPTIFSDENRCSSGRCAPSMGLYLNKIEY